LYTTPADRSQADERYARARSTSDLSHSEGPCDADKLLAAAYAARGSERRSLALEVHNVLISPDLRGARAAADKLAGWVRRRSLRERGGEALTRVQAVDLVMRLFKLWNKRACVTCEGRGHPLRHNSPVLDESRDCSECLGTGLIPLERVVRLEHAKAAREIEREVLSLQSVIFKDMADILSGRRGLV
jgi:hypothetical protein